MIDSKESIPPAGIDSLESIIGLLKCLKIDVPVPYSSSKLFEGLREAKFGIWNFKVPHFLSK
jgi:hypothetical protein